MQELMSRHKAYALSPRDCLKTTLFQKWQRIVAPPGKRGRRTVALHEKHQPVKPNGHPNRQREIGFCCPRNDALVVDFLRLFATILGSIGFSLSSVRFNNFVRNPSTIRCTFLLTVSRCLFHWSDLSQVWIILRSSYLNITMIRFSFNFTNCINWWFG